MLTPVLLSSADGVEVYAKYGCVPPHSPDGALPDNFPDSADELTVCPRPLCSLLETVRLIHVFLKVSRVIEGEWEAESCTALKLALGCSSASAPR